MLLEVRQKSFKFSWFTIEDESQVCSILLLYSMNSLCYYGRCDDAVSLTLHRLRVSESLNGVHA